MHAGLPCNLDSVLRMNPAVGLSPYRFDATLNQSPLNAGKSPWQNSKTSALIHREIAHTAFQYPFALSMADCMQGNGKEWTKTLVEAIGELANAAGGHARSFYEMAPKSLVARLTPSLVAGFDTYGFDIEGTFRELNRVKKDDLPGKEIWVGGDVARQMPTSERDRLAKEGVHFFDNPQKLLAEVANAALAE